MQPYESDINDVAMDLHQTLDAISDTTQLLEKEGAYGQTAWCELHKSNCVVAPQRGGAGMLLVGAGMTCTDHSPIGMQEGLAGASTLPCMSFIRSLQEDMPDAAILECAASWDSMMAATTCRKTHTLHTCSPAPCPSQFGWPVARVRFWGIALSNSWRMTMTWKDFSACFRRTCTMDGHAFFAAPDVIVEAELLKEARKQAVHVAPSEKPNFADHALSAGHTRRLKSARDLSESKGWAGPLLSDLDHNPLKKARVSTTGKMMTQLTHGTIWSDAAQRPLVRQECLSLQGFQTLPSVHGDSCPLPWAECMDSLSPGQVHQLSGNGMHMHVLVLVLCLLLGCAEPMPADSD